MVSTTRHNIGSKNVHQSGRELFPVPPINIRDVALKNIEGKGGSYGNTIYYNRFNYIESNIMGYIITQSEEKVNVLEDIDVMIDEEKEEVFIFDYYEDAVAYLNCHGIKELSTGFPFNIKIEKIQ